ncbi:MAG: hypothetical protein Q8N02_04100 [Methylotenera sp.]|nr:hypothetical protein [Methylotenera sp.]MDO9233770.1 hypothetical protein [Methylotenera sp.]MDO9388640.1 hypothetical protein [Methylotenera sp.]MDP2402237.1 hypothetical protein [Methylotenera sp.]MDP3094750.1 hypothetical protein [Methylotenera sp.]
MLNTPSQSQPSKLLELVAAKVQVKHYSIRTETQYLQWIKGLFIFTMVHSHCNCTTSSL